MKFLLVIWFGLGCFTVNAQAYIKSRNLQVTDNKTTNIIFPAQISSIDRGSERIVVQKSTGNVLRVKADSAFVDTTNLTVITTDGKLYSFLVSYAASPVILNIDLSLSETVNTDTALYSLSQKVVRLKNNLYGIRYSSGNVKLSVTGIYTTGEIIVCRLRIENASSLSFQMGRLRCYVNGSHSSKRMPSQQSEITPLYIHPASALIKERQGIVMSLLLPKAALGSDQALQINLTEKDGERQLSVSVSNKFLLNAFIIH